MDPSRGDTSDLDLGENDRFGSWPSHDIFTHGTYITTAGFTSQDHTELEEGHIRLVGIDLHAPKGVIRCETCIFPSSETPDYTALSYTWGSPLGQHSIELDGRIVELPNNLWRFLSQAVQLPGEFSGWLWIDALSIDQSSSWERMHQVGVMAKIFGGAKQVMVWLGPAYAGSDTLMETLRLGTMPEPHQERRRLFTLFEARDDNALLHLCRRPYWGRLWVLQELNAAHDTRLMCGRLIITKSSFMAITSMQTIDLAGLSRMKGTIRQMRGTPAVAMIEACGDLNSKPQLWTLLQATRHLRCADARDRVYAVLSVAEGYDEIAPDYTIPTTTLLDRLLRNEHKLVLAQSVGQVALHCSELERVFYMPQRDLERECDGIPSFPPTWASVFGHPEVTRLLEGYPDARWTNFRIQELQHLLHLERERKQDLMPHSRPNDRHCTRNGSMSFRIATIRCSEFQWLRAKRAVHRSTMAMLDRFLCSQGEWDSSLCTCVTRTTHLFELPSWTSWQRWRTDPFKTAVIPRVLSPEWEDCPQNPIRMILTAIPSCLKHSGVDDSNEPTWLPCQPMCDIMRQQPLNTFQSPRVEELGISDDMLFDVIDFACGDKDLLHTRYSNFLPRAIVDTFAPRVGNRPSLARS